MSSTDLIKSQNPEEEELTRKKEELAVLEEELADLLSQKADTHAAMEGFFGSLDASLAAKIAEREMLRAALAQALAALHPEEPDYQQEAEQAKQDAETAWNESQGFGEDFASKVIEDFELIQKIRSSDEYKALYRQLVKLTHPDLARNPEDIARRTAFMQRVNAANDRGDFEALKALSDSWQSSADSVEGEGTGAELIRAIRQISNTRERIVLAQGELTSLYEGEDYIAFFRAQEMGFEEYITLLSQELDSEIEGLQYTKETTKEILRQELDKLANS